MHSDHLTLPDGTTITPDLITRHQSSGLTWLDTVQGDQYLITGGYDPETGTWSEGATVERIDSDEAATAAQARWEALVAPGDLVAHVQLGEDGHRGSKEGVPHLSHDPVVASILRATCEVYGLTDTNLLWGRRKGVDARYGAVQAMLLLGWDLARALTSIHHSKNTNHAYRQSIRDGRGRDKAEEILRLAGLRVTTGDVLPTQEPPAVACEPRARIEDAGGVTGDPVSAEPSNVIDCSDWQERLNRRAATRTHRETLAAVDALVLDDLEGRLSPETYYRYCVENTPAGVLWIDVDHAGIYLSLDQHPWDSIVDFALVTTVDDRLAALRGELLRVGDLKSQ